MSDTVRHIDPEVSVVRGEQIGVATAGRVFLLSGAADDQTIARFDRARECNDWTTIGGIVSDAVATPRPVGAGPAAELRYHDEPITGPVPVTLDGDPVVARTAYNGGRLDRSGFSVVQRRTPARSIAYRVVVVEPTLSPAERAAAVRLPEDSTQLPDRSIPRGACSASAPHTTG